MAEIWKPQSSDIHKYWVSTILDEASDLLNSWETTFIESIDERLSMKLPLTQRQEEILEKIYAEKTK